MKSWLMGLLIGAGVTTVAGGLLAVAFVAGRERVPFPASPASFLETGPASTIPGDRPAPSQEMAPWDLEDKGRGVRGTVRVFEGTAAGDSRGGQEALVLLHPGGTVMAFCAFSEEIPLIKTGSHVKIRGTVSAYKPQDRNVFFDQCQVLEVREGPKRDYSIPPPLPVPARPRGR